MRSIVAAAAALLAVVPGWCSTYTATSTADSGVGSLRQAIMDANAHTGTDTITFATGLSGKKVKPLAELPALSEQAVVDGDLNDDRAPDITLDGSLLGGNGSGLVVRADQCTVQGLAVINFPEAGVLLDGVEGCTVRDCHLGVNLAGEAAAPSAHGDLRILDGRSHVIGQPGRRNIFAGQPDGSLVGVGCEEAVIEGNYFGLDRAGAAKLPSDGTGIDLQPGATLGARLNTIRGNVFAGIAGGIALLGADDNTVEGNLFGLAADGDTSVALSDWCVDLGDGASGNLIGGQAAGDGNVLCGGESTDGVRVWGEGTVGNRIEGNYFGMDAAGTVRRPLLYGVFVFLEAGAQMIGGSTPAAGNYFASSISPYSSLGIWLQEAGSGSAILNNTFGVLPNGARARRIGYHISVITATRVAIRDNLFDSADTGVQAYSFTGLTSLVATGNRFRNLGKALDIGVGAAVVLGNLGNASAYDDGGNTFASSNTWAVYNTGSNRVPAEGNSWGTSVWDEIEARVYDKAENPNYGRVDFDPLANGASPSGVTVAITGAAATPTAAGGAEIAFGLSAPGEVTVQVLNVAGRPVATVMQDRPSEAGLQRVLWNGQSAAGTPVPAGPYLVSVTARSAAGSVNRAVARVALRR